MTTLVTGATGFVGSAVARTLAARGHSLRLLTRPASDRRNLAGLDAEIVTGDLTDPESLAAAALLADQAAQAGDTVAATRYWNDYDRLWVYSWEHFVDHTYGAWYRILTCDNRKYSDEKSPAGKTDYHTMGACYEVLTHALADAPTDLTR